LIYDSFSLLKKRAVPKEIVKEVYNKIYYLSIYTKGTKK